MDHPDINVLDPELKLITPTEKHGQHSIGVVANYADDEETRFLLTPEGCGLLTSAGIEINIEEGPESTSHSPTRPMPNSALKS